MTKTQSEYPRCSVALKGSFWGLTTFFNPSGYRNKYENYRRFRENSKKQGLKLLSVELAFDDDPFTLEKDRDAEILIQIRGTREKNLLWQKERLLNLGLAHLPEECDKVCWSDCDILFKNDAWIEETARQLETYPVVQPYERVARLSKGICDLNEEEVKIHETVPSLLYQRANKIKKPGELGFAWAARKAFLEKVFFYDAIPTGGQDVILARSFVGDATVGKWLQRYSTRAMRSDQDFYVSKVRKEIQGGSHYTNGTILHLWHGSTKERLYVMRWNLLKLFSFVPSKDIRIDANGIWEWSSDKPRLHKAIREYFEMRNEEGKGTASHSPLLNTLIVKQRKFKVLEQCFGFVRDKFG